jgi:hypothetical protein
MKRFDTWYLLALLFCMPMVAQAHGDACAKPFQTSGSIALPVGFSGVTAQFSVPTGYRLQIEQISGSVRLASNTDRATFQVGTTVGGAFAWHELAVAEGFGAIDRKTFGSVTLYADRSTDVRISIGRISPSNPATNAIWAVTGCLYPA